jgi:hypothetical protein
MLDCVEAIFSRASSSSHSAFHLYTLIRLRGCHVEKVNKHVAQFVEAAVERARCIISVRDILWAAEACIEKNPHIIKYEDLTLFSHQRELFAALRDSKSLCSNKLVLYTAPTGTGKTLSPLGLS